MNDCFSKAVLFFATLLVASYTASTLAATPALPDLAVKAYLLKDVTSDTVIASKNSEDRVEPASLTKIMTAYLSFNALKSGALSLEKTIKISEKAYKAEGSRMFIEQRVPVSIDELLYGMIVQSGNDAAIALAEEIAGSEKAFVSQMNKTAASLGLQHTHFKNATGLPDPEHYTTAADLMRLAEALIRDFPEEYKRYYSVKTYTYNKIKQDNRNRLLWLDPHVDGMKTGHTKSAGYCLIASAERDTVRHISVVLGAKSNQARANESQRLLNFGFMHYETTLVYKKGQKVNTFKVWKGSQASIDVIANANVYVTLPKGDVAQMKGVVESEQPLFAPIEAGQTIGQMKLMLNGEPVKKFPLYAKEAVASAGLFGQVWDSIQLWLE